MTGLGALAWCWIYDRYPNLLPLALSHALLTLAILYAFDDAITGRLRVGRVSAHTVSAACLTVTQAEGCTRRSAFDDDQRRDR